MSITTYVLRLPQMLLPVLAVKTLLSISCGGELGKNKKREEHREIKTRTQEPSQFIINKKMYNSREISQQSQRP